MITAIQNSSREELTDIFRQQNWNSYQTTASTSHAHIFKTDFLNM